MRVIEERRNQRKNLHENIVASDIDEWSFKAHGLCLQSIKNTHTHRTLTTDHLTAETPEVHVSISIGVIDTLRNTLQVGLVRIIRAVVARILRILPGLVVEVRALQV